MIKAIAFDWGGVIEMIEGGLIKKISQYLNVSEEDWNEVYYSLIYLFHTNQSSWEGVANLVAKNFNATEEQIFHMQEMIKENRKTRNINLGLIEIIKDLKNKNYKIGLLSNNYVELRQEIKDFSLVDLFDTIVISAEVGFYKPQPEIFKILFDKLGLKSNEVAFVDDTPNSLSGAESIGYTPILFIDNQKLKEDLEKLGIIL
jgi:epoxide hydrolase-like predicted phosphatase